MVDSVLVHAIRCSFPQQLYFFQVFSEVCWHHFICTLLLSSLTDSRFLLLRLFLQCFHSWLVNFFQTLYLRLVLPHWLFLCESFITTSLVFSGRCQVFADWVLFLVMTICGHVSKTVVDTQQLFFLLSKSVVFEFLVLKSRHWVVVLNLLSVLLLHC
jgi:hypothetical protein